MDRVIKNNQAYYETPWRKQLQRIGLFLVVLVLFATIAGIYLSINARAAVIGRQIQNNRIRINELENEIAGQQSLLAILTSSSEMEKRAATMGFRLATTDEITYLVVNGYQDRMPAVLASETNTFIESTPSSISSNYTKSLLDWIQENISIPQMFKGEVKP